MRDEHIGKALAKWRKKNDLNQAQVAQDPGMHPTTLSDIENGKRRVSDAQLIRLCAAIGIPVFQVTDDAYVDYRKELEKSASEPGGWLLAASANVSLPEMEERLESWMSETARYYRAYYRFVRSPSEVEILRANLRASPDEAPRSEELRKGRRKPRKR